MTIEAHQERIAIEHAAVFNEWVKRFATNPKEFTALLDPDGKPFNDYGANCAAYFRQLYSELYPHDRTNRTPIA